MSIEHNYAIPVSGASVTLAHGFGWNWTAYGPRVAEGGWSRHKDSAEWQAQNAEERLK